jgi:uncharacterized membrane protein
MADVEGMIADAQGLSAQERRQLVESLAPPRDDQSLRVIWLTLLFILGAIAVGALVSGVVLLMNNKDATAIWPIATAVVGGLVGLMSPTPSNTSG